MAGRLESRALLDDALEQLAGGAARRTANPGHNPSQKRGVAPWARGVCWVCLNTTISAFCVRRKQAQKMAMLRSQDPVLVGARAGTNTRQGSACLNVFPKRRGVLMRTSPGHDSQPCFCMMAGFCTPQSSRYMTRAEALKKFSWNSSWWADCDAR